MMGTLSAPAAARVEGVDVAPAHARTPRGSRPRVWRGAWRGAASGRRQEEGRLRTSQLAGPRPWHDPNAAGQFVARRLGSLFELEARVTL